MRHESVDVAIAPVISQVFPLLGQVIIGFGTSTEADPLSGSLEEFCTLRTNAKLPRYPLKIKKEAFHF
ncbi:hypothetical protein [Coleofasciculus sp. FACHB-1120]|uniref:hypothetical protein n=1 Tax=Coleofasciculus sp. FACHB-1120 TaxID=2692783 RepID=UPI001683B7C0|nr:hypothetical protein [Coleofasciculus sp. FACHB-1120]MBD2742395.1 hypothetical protein [Coleofasciculus sp. FACHB-1120]